MERVLFIFDIDGTLLITEGAGRDAIREACRQVLSAYGIEKIPPLKEMMEGIEFAGRTDPQIFADILKKFIPEREIPSAVKKLAELYLRYLPDSLRRANRGRVLPGVRETLQWLKGHPRAVMGLGTGNFRRGAEIKLRHYGLDGFFSFGGFGDDGENRAQLLEIAVERARRETGYPFQRSQIWVIGDTVRDIRAARAIGVGAIAVATGTVSYETLASERPEYLWRDMTGGVEKFAQILER